MKTKKKELDVDFIGGTSPLTKEEEKRISDVIKKLKEKRLVANSRPKRKSALKKRVTA